MAEKTVIDVKYVFTNNSHILLRFSIYFNTGIINYIIDIKTIIRVYDV